MNEDRIIKMSKYGECHLVTGQYGNGRLALQIVSKIGEPIAKLTVNLPNEHLEEGEFFVKGWSENEVIISDVLASGIFEDTGKRISLGFVQAFVWQFTDQKEGDNKC